MRAGFNWELGPFEMWDAAGVASTVARMKALGLRSARASKRCWLRPAASWYAPTAARASSRPQVNWSPVPAVPGHARVADFRRSQRRGPLQLRRIAGRSRRRHRCIELHSLKNAIGGDVLAMISAVLKPDSDAVRDFAGFVIAGDRENFSVGANLMQLLLAAQEGEWDELAAVIHSFQQMTAAIKFCPRPVVPRPSASPSAAARRFACTPRAVSPTPRLTSAWSKPASA
jgi:3-hydroxyacyl-CoA dehydrogenase